MGERGPLPNPTARRRNQRALPGKHITVARPAMPRDLPAEGQSEWKRIVPELEAVGLLAKVDRAVLIRYVSAWADWVEIQGLLRQSGKLLKGPRGHFVRNPLWFQLQDAGATVTELGRQLGLTPIARLRAGIVHEWPEDTAVPEGPTALDEYRRQLLG